MARIDDSTSRRHRRARGALVIGLLWALSGAGCYSALQSMPKGTSFAGQPHPASEVRFLADLTYVDREGERHVDQTIFDAAFAIIAEARRLLIVDMFLYNDFQGEHPETTRPLSKELTEALIAAKKAHPDLQAVVISDPVNTVYGGIESEHFEALRAAGIPVVVTKLEALRDSNPTYSGFWRFLAQPFGKPNGGLMPSPFGEGRVSLLSYLSLLNFKANHRKVVIADRGDDYVALVASANPHDGSSAHGNVALRLNGPAVADLLETEKAVIAFSGGDVPEIEIAPAVAPSDTSAQVVTEGKIRATLLETLDGAAPGDHVDVAMFYLSDKTVVRALIAANERGAAVRVLLDPNKDAFGYKKNGVPNRPVGSNLREGGVDVRWCDTHGEQCHAKMLLLNRADGSSVLVLGSANFTRRNLQDYNLETSVAIRGPSDAQVFLDASAYFHLVWHNDPRRRFSAAYDAYEDTSLRKELLYDLQEKSGLGSF